MSATVYGQQLSKLGLGDRTVQSNTTVGDQRGYLMNVDGQTTETADHHASKQRPGCRQSHE